MAAGTSSGSDIISPNCFLNPSRRASTSGLQNLRNSQIFSSLMMRAYPIWDFDSPCNMFTSLRLWEGWSWKLLVGLISVCILHIHSGNQIQQMTGAPMIFWQLWQNLVIMASSSIDFTSVSSSSGNVPWHQWNSSFSQSNTRLLWQRMQSSSLLLSLVY